MVSYPMRTLPSDGVTERRGFLGLAGLAGAGLATLAAPAALGASAPQAAAASSHPTRRDIAILRFLAAAELVETDLWQQYAELAHSNSATARRWKQSTTTCRSTRSMSPRMS